MRVLMVSKYFYPVPGGIETNALFIARGLVKRGHHVTVVAADKGKAREEKVQGVRVIRVPVRGTPGNTPITPGVFSAVLREDFDVLHLHEPNPFMNFLAVKANFLKRKPIVVTYHSDIVSHSPAIKAFKAVYVHGYQRFLTFKLAKVIMPTSPQYIELSDILPKFKKKCFVVPNGVDLHEFRPKTVRKNKNEKRVLFLGRLIYYKGLHVLIKAFERVAREVPNAKLVIAGEGKLESQLREQVKQAGLEKRVEFIAKRLTEAETLREFNKCDVFVLPSIHRTEAFGIVLLEAMACGKPIITTDVSGTKYVAENCGIVVKTGDDRELASAIVKVLKSEALRKQMGRKSLAKVKRFSWDRVAELVEKAYLKALS